MSSYEVLSVSFTSAQLVAGHEPWSTPLVPGHHTYINAAYLLGGPQCLRELAALSSVV